MAVVKPVELRHLGFLVTLGSYVGLGALAPLRIRDTGVDAGCEKIIVQGTYWLCLVRLILH